MIPWAIVPVKSLRQSKSRLAALFTPAEREALMRDLLHRSLGVLQSVEGLAQTLVISRDETVHALAADLGARPATEPTPPDLNRAISEGVRLARAAGATAVLVLPADLPFLKQGDVAQIIAALAAVDAATVASAAGAMVLCPDRHQTGTNALALRTTAAYQFQFGLGSFRRHWLEAERLGLAGTVLRPAGVTFDLDTVDDWHLYKAHRYDWPVETAGGATLQ